MHSKPSIQFRMSWTFCCRLIRQSGKFLLVPLSNLHVSVPVSNRKLRTIVSMWRVQSRKVPQRQKLFQTNNTWLIESQFDLCHRKSTRNYDAFPGVRLAQFANRSFPETQFVWALILTDYFNWKFLHQVSGLKPLLRWPLNGRLFSCRRIFIGSMFVMESIATNLHVFHFKLNFSSKIENTQWRAIPQSK